MLVISILLSTIYVVLISIFYYGWTQLQFFSSSPNCRTSISVIIPMRNEHKNIHFLLSDIFQQDYPNTLFEIILIDDHSTDNSLEIAQSFQRNTFTILQLPKDKAGKKAALLYGIQHSTGELIITTDADCRVGKHWLRTFASAFENGNAVLLFAPVIAQGKGFWHDCLSLEQLALQGSTGGAAACNIPIMCNGANMAFSQSVFADIEPIYTNNSIHSGDDMFVMMELQRKYNGQIEYIKSTEAIVTTQFPANFQSFVQQRKRWAAKAPYYNNINVIVSGIVIFGTNSALFVTLLVGIFQYLWIPFIILFFTKSIIDFVFLYRVATFFHQKSVLKWFPVVQSFYFIYVTFTVVLAFISNTKWKERIINK